MSVKRDVTRQMGLAILCVTFLGIPAAVSAKTTEFDLKGRKVRVDVEKIATAPELNATATSKHPVVQLYFHYQRLLAEGKLDEASDLTASPEEDQKEKKAYAERLGGAEVLQEQMKQVLAMHIRAAYVLHAGNQKMLLAKHPQQGYAATFYRCVKDLCKIDKHPDDPANADLAAIFGQIRLGKIKL